MNNGSDDIEEQIRREMEQEIERNHQPRQPIQVQLPELQNTQNYSSTTNGKENSINNINEVNEEDLIKAEIEARLLRKRQQREEKTKRAAAEQARREAEEQAKREAEEQARRQAAEQARRQAEEQAKHEAEEQARREAEEQAKREAAEQARREAEEQAKREAEEQAKREAAEQARRQAAEQARHEAAEQARREAAEQAKREAEEQAKREAAEQARRQAAEQARREAEEQAKREAEEQARREAEEQAKREAEEQARRQAAEQARREAAEQARREAAEQARRQAAEQARRQAAEQARREAAEQARRQAAEQAKREAATRQAQMEEQERQRQASHEAELEEIRRQAREAVFREYAEKSKQTAERAAERARKRASLSDSINTPGTSITTIDSSHNATDNERRLSNIKLAVSNQISEQETSILADDMREIKEQNAHEFENNREYNKEPRSMVLNSEKASSVKQNEGMQQFNSKHTNPVRNNYDKESITSDSENDQDNRSSNNYNDTDSESNNGDNDDTSHNNASSEKSNMQLSDQALSAFRNDNGILCRCSISQLNLFDELRQPQPTKPKPELASFELTLNNELRELGFSTEQGKRNKIEVHRYNTIREAGRCLFPPDEMSSEIPPHVKIQLGFFSAKQTIMSLQKVTQYQITDRERECQGNERPLSTLTCYFESEVLENPMLTIDDEAFPHNAPSEQLYTRADILRGGEHAICKAVSSISYGDPIQVWERVQNEPSVVSERLMPHTSQGPNADNARNSTTDNDDTNTVNNKKKVSALTIVTNNTSNSNANNTESVNNNSIIKTANTSFTIAAKTPNSTAHDLWVSGLETKKPIPVMRTFTGGRIFYIEATKLRSAVIREHGEGIDPFFISAAFYSITDNSRNKVSDTFYFDSGIDIFYPHKERSNLAKTNKVITFIPNEFLGTLFVIVRVYRPCNEEFDSYVDFYTRPERYRPVHFAPMKQETLLLAQTSDVCEELGWSCARVDREKALKNLIIITQLYRKPMRDKEVLKLALDKRSRNALKTLPFEINLELHDVTKYEVAFPSSSANPQPVENETLVSLLNPDVPGARAQIYRYAPCCIPILNSGYFTTYTNTYYLRLAEMHVNITGTLRNIPSSHHTFAVQVCMKDRDDNLSDEGAIRCIYGRGLNCLALDTHAWSSSVNGSTEFSLSDEIKFELPLNLTDRHHLFFTLYAMYMKRTSPTEGVPRAIKVGYAICPVAVNGVVHVRDHMELKFIAHDHAAKASAGGYLSHFPKAPISAHINGGEPVLLVNTQTRTSVHASNKVIAGVFRNCGASLAEITKNDHVLETSGELVNIPTPRPGVADPHYQVIKLISELPLAEILAFYPFLSAYALALIGSASSTVSLASRMHMLDTLLLITSKSQAFDTNRHTVQRRHGVAETATIFAKSSAASVLYHFLTNNTLYEDNINTIITTSTDDNNRESSSNREHSQSHEFRLYAGVAETWLQILSALAPQAAPQAASQTESISSAINSTTTTTNKSKNNSKDNSVTTDGVKNVSITGSPKLTTLKLGANNSFFYVNESASKNGAATTSATRSTSINNNNINNNSSVVSNASRVISTQAVGSNTNPNVRNIEREMSDLSWFLFDIILRSIYIWCNDHPSPSRVERFDKSFYDTVGELCVRVLARLSVYDESILVKRVAVFVRNLMLYCDRGQVLTIYERIITHFEEQNNYESLTNFFRYVLDDNDVVFMLLPSSANSEPVFLTSLLTRAFSTLLVHQSRSIRTIACQVMYHFLRRLANDPFVSSTALTRIATQLFALVRNMGRAWQSLTNAQVSDKVPTHVMLHEQRQLTMIALWILYYTPVSHLVQWMRNEPESSALSGLMQMITDAQTYFHYSAGINKQRKYDTLETANTTNTTNNNNNSNTNNNDAVNPLVKEWDARHATFVTAIGTRLCSLFLHAITPTLRMVKTNERHPCVFPFFVMLESVLKLGNSTISLQMSAALMHETVCQLFPEIMSRKAKMSSGMVLLTFKLMSSCCQYVRTTAGWTFLLMSQSFYAWVHSLSKIKSLTANALVTVAESRMRDLRLAGRFIEFEFDDLIEEAKVEEIDYIRPSPNYDSRYEDDTNAPGGDALMRYKYHVSEAYMSVEPILPWPAYLRERKEQSELLLQEQQQREQEQEQNGTHTYSSDRMSKEQHGNNNDNKALIKIANKSKSNHTSTNVKKFSEEFNSMTATVLSLFNDVLQLKVDDSMKFKEAKIFAYFEVFRNFLQQNALREALKWLERLHKAHIVNRDYAEASMVLVFNAALCFRVTEVYYSVKGKSSRGARMPYGVFTRMFWQDYVRVLPEVDQLLPLDAVFAIVNELYVCPEDACFTIEGQIKTLKEAAEHADKAQYYKFSLDIIHLVDTYLQLIHDYEGCTVAYNAMHSWATAIANDGVEQRNNTYFFMWARMEREEDNRNSSESKLLLHAPSTINASASSSLSVSNEMHVVNDNMVGEKPHGLAHGKPIRRIYKMPTNFTVNDFREYATEYLTLLFGDPSLIEVTDELTETLPALPEPDSKRKRAAAIHRPPNHCLLTVCEVEPYFPKEQPIPPDGFDKSMHINHFVNVQHAWLSERGYSPRQFNVMQQCMTISTYELDRSFPSTTSAIDIAEIHKVNLDPYETAEEVISNRRDEVRHLAKNRELIVGLKEALMVRGLPPGVYMKEVIKAMGDHPSIMSVLEELCTLVRTRMVEADAMNAMLTHAEDYALVLKAITDVECCLIAANPEQNNNQQK